MKRVRAALVMGLAMASLAPLGAARVAHAEGPGDGGGLLEEEVDEAAAKADADYQRGIRLTKHGQNAEALAAFERALPKKGDVPDLLYNLVQVAKAEKQHDKVALYGQSFLLLEPDTKDSTAMSAAVEAAFATLEKRSRVIVNCSFRVPEGATVFVNDAPVADGKRQLVRLPVGAYTLRVEQSDHKPIAQKLVVEAGKPVSLELKPEKVIHHGKVTIKTDPPEGVQVFMDDQRIGQTPLTAPLELESGKRILFRFEKLGYETWVRYVELVKNEDLTLTPTLEKVKAPFVEPPSGGPGKH